MFKVVKDVFLFGDMLVFCVWFKRIKEVMNDEKYWEMISECIKKWKCDNFEEYVEVRMKNWEKIRFFEV